MMKKRKRYFKQAGNSTTDAVKYQKMRNKVVKLREAKNAFFAISSLTPRSFGKP